MVTPTPSRFSPSSAGSPETASVPSVASAGSPETAAAWKTLEGVPDPEIPEISVVDLGVVRAVEKSGAEWRVVITPTYSGCPAYEVMERDIARAMARAGFAPVKVSRALHPPWTTDWMSDKARAALQAAGIAPPGPASETTVVFVPPTVACPRCGARGPEVIAPQGATACKALLRCRACLEPFEHFKAI